MKHLVFYDGECGFCDRSVQVLLKVDKDRLFAFAPLQGTTAARYLGSQKRPLDADSLILIENYQENTRKTYLYGKAVCRICWLLEGWWKLIGWISFLPGPLYDWIYKIVAKNRHRFFKNSSSCLLPDPGSKDRFLP